MTSTELANLLRTLASKLDLDDQNLVRRLAQEQIRLRGIAARVRDFLPLGDLGERASDRAFDDLADELAWAADGLPSTLNQLHRDQPPGMLGDGEADRDT